MEKKTISAGIIGAGGFIGQEHLKRLTKRIDGVAVTALYDINKEKTDALAAAYGAESMESVDALIASDKVDAIVITAWDGVHAEMTNKAIAAGKPVFCEKPLATTKADCAEIVRIEQAAGRNLVQVGFMRRYDPDYRKIKAILDSGELGKPLMAHCISRTPRIAAGFTNAMQVTNVLIQKIDQFRWLFGEELVRGQMLAARNTKFAADGLNDPQLALMWTESNILIDVERSVHSYYGYKIDMEIVCGKDTIRLPLDTNVNVLMDFGGGVTGTLWASQIAIGHECDSGIYIIGTEGSLEWTATDCDHLIYTPRSQPSQRLSAGADYLLDASTRLSRVGAGHNEGFIEAFSNIYRSFCNVLSDRKAGRENTTDTFPTVEDGVLGVRFVEACVRSHTAGGVWMDV